jgi:hypothetical protein
VGGGVVIKGSLDKGRVCYRVDDRKQAYHRFLRSILPKHFICGAKSWGRVNP